MSDAVDVGKDVNGHKERGAGLPFCVLGGRVLRRLRGGKGGYPSQFFRPFALLGFWAEATFEVGDHLPMRALVPRRIHGIRSRGSHKWWLVPRQYQWRGLLEEVRLKKDNIPEAHMRP